ncbi:MAG TPA: FCD domain-containing protein [Chloroflexota bacterium]|jgi:DNA-binding FadR family transcriptional regulator|nr:FCD domain-containing protein [Chloroflexota bacterium]
MSVARQAVETGGREGRGRRLRQLTLAEMIAGTLRDRILSGELQGSLPRQEDLIAEFRVSPPSIREALRILQTEGLITVQRGSIGGATIHLPTPSQAAYMLAMVLQSRGATLDSVGFAIRRVEPLCAGLCASSERRHVIADRLDRNIEASVECMDVPYDYLVLAREFHEELVEGCGNDTVSLVLGALESIWSSHVEVPYATMGVYDDREARLRSVDEHRAIADAIRQGAAAEAEQIARTHYSGSRNTGVVGRQLPVQAQVLRDL